MSFQLILIHQSSWIHVFCASYLSSSFGFCTVVTDALAFSVHRITGRAHVHLSNLLTFKVKLTLFNYEIVVSQCSQSYVGHARKF